MKRRDFFKTASAFVCVGAIPLSSAQAKTYKYPLIGMPLIGCIFKETEDLKKLMVIHEKKIHSVGKLGNGNIELFFQKNTEPIPNVKGKLTNLPLKLSYSAETIVDLETYEILKSRSGFAQLVIPEGANKDLVLENRKERDEIRRTCHRHS